MNKSPYFRSRKPGIRKREPMRRRPATQDLVRWAREAMKQRGFLVDLPKPAIWQTDKLVEPSFDTLKLPDLSEWHWSSIDNDDSRDLDQIEFAKEEAGGIRIYVGIADVDAFVPAGSPLDDAARQNTTSVYTGIITFPMLPEKLSTDLSSLNEGEKRLAVVVEMLIAENGNVQESSVYRAIVQNKTQLTYNAVSLWLEGKANGGDSDPVPSGPGARTIRGIQQSDVLQEQLVLQDRAAQALRQRRHEAGALSLRTIELQPVVSDKGEVEELQERIQTRAGQLIEDLMIAANTAIANFLDNRSCPSMRRVVETPARWDRIVALARSLGTILPDVPDSRSLELFLRAQQRANPEAFPELSLAVVKMLGRGKYMPKHSKDDSPGHFGLAVLHYSHSTAPNRRYPDLITQRLVKAALSNDTCAYSFAQLQQLALECTEKEDLANKVERFVKKCVAATILMDYIGDSFDGIISGKSKSSVWVRLLHPPVEGKLLVESNGIDVGDRVRVRLVSVQPERGFVDFELE